MKCDHAPCDRAPLGIATWPRASEASQKAITPLLSDFGSWKARQLLEGDAV
jgi:hypothetical protein